MTLDRRHFLTLGAGLLLAACGKEDAAPDAPVHLLDAPATSLAALRGQPVLLTFWATSCPGCIEEIPMLNALHAEYSARGLKVIGAAMSYDPEPQVRALIERKDIRYPIALDRGDSLSLAMGKVRLTPTTILLDRKGQVIYKKIGIFDKAKLKGLIEDSLAQG